MMQILRRCGLKQDHTGQLYEQVVLGDGRREWVEERLITAETTPFPFFLDTSDLTHRWVAVDRQLFIRAHCGRRDCGCEAVPIFQPGA